MVHESQDLGRTDCETKPLQPPGEEAESPVSARILCRLSPYAGPVGSLSALVAAVGFVLLPDTLVARCFLVAVGLTAVFMLNVWAMVMVRGHRTSHSVESADPAAVVYGAPLPMFALHIETLTMLHANEHFCAILGYGRHELEGQVGLGLTPEWGKARARQGLERLLRTGRSEARAVPWLRRDGSLLWADMYGRMVEWQGRHIALLAVHDITERKIMEDELVRQSEDSRRVNRELRENLSRLAESEARYRGLFTHAMDAVLLVNASDGQVLDANPRALQLMSVADSGAIIGQPLSALEQTSPTSLGDIVRTIAGGRGVILPELPFQRRDGQVVFLDVSGGLVSTEPNTVVQLVLHDVTDRRALREALENANAELKRQGTALMEANAQLARMSEAKSQFLANMSHEIRTPLNAINGFAELLADESFGKLDDEQRSFVQHIIEAGQHLLQLINDVIDLSKVEAGTIELDRQPLSINRVAEQTIRVIKGMARKRGVAVRLRPDPSDPVVLADERRVKQVLFNLLSNAVRYSPEGSPVEVRIEGDTDRAKVSVTDQGIGIAPEDQERIFAEFVRVGPDAGTGAGAGLGLSLSRELVELHGGQIGVVSSLGQGSTFWFTLPTASVPDEAASAAESIADVSAPDYRPIC